MNTVQSPQQKNPPKRLLVCCQAVDRDHPILGFFVSWLRAFADDFDRLDVICLEEGEHGLPAHVHVHSLGKETGAGKLRMLARFYRYFSRVFLGQGVEYVFFHMGAIYNILAAPFYLYAKLKRPCPRFYWWKAHGHIDRMGRFALLFVDRVYTSTASGFPLETKKRSVIGQAIDTELFRCREEKREKRVIFTGRIMPVKHLEVFIAAAALLKARHPDCTFAVIGPFADVSYEQHLKRVAAEAGLGETLFVGPLSQPLLVAEYCRATLFLNTSQTHSMDKTVLEAILCGCVPLTANRAFAELLGPDGLYSEEQSAEWYAGKADELLRSDLAELRKRLQERVGTEHSLATFSERIFKQDAVT